MSDDDPYRLVARGINASENSTGDVGATNSNSSATGNGQFLSGTWLPLLKSQRPDLSAGKSDQQLLSMRADPTLAEDMTAAYAKQNALSLSDAGLPVTPATLHLAHVVGPGGAAAVLKAAPTAPLSAVLGQDAVAANPTWARMTVAQLHDRMHSRVQGGMAAASDEDAQWGKLGAQAQPAAPAAAPPLTDDEEAQWGKFGTQPVDHGRPSSDFRYVTPYTAPDGSLTSIAPEDYDRFNALIKYDQEHPAPAPKPGTIDPVTHQPVQIAGEAGNTPVTRFMAQGAPVSGASSPVTAAIGSLPTDPAQRARILASHYYPNVPLNEAMSHLTPAPDGGMIVLGENGRPVYEDPATPSLSAPSTLRPGNLLAYGASAVGPAMPAVGGAAGSLAALPTSMAAGPLLAAGGAAAGDAARQGAARLFDPTPSATSYDPVQTGREALLAGGTQLLGGAGANILASNALRMTPRDLSALRSNSLIDAAHDAYGRAGGQGVQLTPGQATGLPSLLQYEDAAKTLPGTSDAAEAFYRRQGLQLHDAGQNLLSTISPNADKTDAALMFQQGAEDAVRGVKKNANAMARDAYNRADAAVMPAPVPGQTRPILGPGTPEKGSPNYDLPGRGFPPLPDNRFKPYDLLGTPDGLSAYNAARVSAANDGIRLPTIAEVEAGATIPFQGWDHMKKVLQGQASEAARAGNNYRATQLTDIANGIKNEVIKANPAYGEALDIVAPGHRLAARLEQSGIGSVADKTGDERARAILAPIFEGNHRAIAEARDAFISSGRESEWYSGVRAYIQDAIDKASMSQQGLNAASLRRQVWGNTDNRAAIRAALTPEQFDGFDKFLQTVEDVARTYPMNSLTATRQAAQNSLRNAAEDQGNVKLIDTVGSVFSPAAYANVGTRLLAGMRSRTVEGNVRNVVSSLFDPEGLKYLEEMANYSPKSIRAGNITAQLLERAVPPTLSGSATSSSGQSPARPVNRLLQVSP